MGSMAEMCGVVPHAVPAGGEGLPAALGVSLKGRREWKGGRWKKTTTNSGTGAGVGWEEAALASDGERGPLARE